ncbi:MAG: hypothetical protein WAL20_03345, partial [Rhodomicrobium sp.]
MFRFRSLSIAAAILFLIAGGTAYGGSVKPQPLGVFAPPSDTVLARVARGGGRSFAARGYRGGAVGVRGPRGVPPGAIGAADGGLMAWVPAGGGPTSV